MTGPSFISLWHACGLATLGYRVVYVLPWLDEVSQQRLWGETRFVDFDEQVDWLQTELEAFGPYKFPECRPYRARFVAGMGSIVPMEDVYRAAPPARCLIASEPEHLCWYPVTTGRRGIRADKTIGLSMTDYETYIRMSGLPFPNSLAGWCPFLHGRALRLRIDLPLSLSPALTLPGITMPVERGPVSCPVTRSASRYAGNRRDLFSRSFPLGKRPGRPCPHRCACQKAHRCHRRRTR